MIHKVPLHERLYAVGGGGGGGGGGGLVPSEQYLVVVGTAVSGHILLQVEGTLTCKDGSIVHLSGD